MIPKPAKILGMAILVAGGLQLSSIGSASAATLPGGISSALPELMQSESAVKQVHRRRYRHYHRRRHGPRYRRRRHGYGYYHNGWWYAAPWFLPPVVVTPAPRYRPRRAHVRWCRNRYRSYNPRTDLFLGYDGRYHRCRSPYRR